jgi:hypothetical protein
MARSGEDPLDWLPLFLREHGVVGASASCAATVSS